MQRQISGAVATHAPVGVEARGKVLPQVAEHHLDLQPAPAEDDGLRARADPRRGDAARLEHRAAPDAHLAVDQWWVVEHEAPLAARGAVTLDELHVLLLEQSLGELERVRDGRGGADENRARTVEGANPFQAPDDVGDLAAEQPAIRVKLVDDHEIQAREEAAPPGVMRKQSCVEHVGVGHHDMPALADRGAPPRRRVAVVGVGPQLDRKAVFERAELGQLVLGQGLGRKEVERPPLRILEQALKDGKVVAEGLSAGGGRHDDQVPALPDGAVGVRLVRVEAVDAATGEGGDQTRAQLGRKGGKIRRGRRNHVIKRYLPLEVRRVERGEADHAAPSEGSRTFVRSQGRPRVLSQVTTPFLSWGRVAWPGPTPN